MKNIVIIGGGTAGWLTSLYIQKHYKDSNIIVIESSKIGILGAGEGATPNFVTFLKFLGINEDEFLKRVNGTKKTGINFENWSENGTKYKHGFNISSDEPKEIYSYHFNARLLAEYLKEIAVGRNITHIDDNINDLILVDNKVKKIKLESDLILDVDFVFDCSGFHRIIGKLYDVKWNSYSEHLKVNSAIPYFLSRNDVEMSTTTNAISMKYGWMWQIPLQNRWGCGYIYDKNLISEEEVKKEVIEYIGMDVQFNKQINFEPGTYNNIWVENCLMVGLSAGFLEPLEATSINTIILELSEFIECKPNDDIERFNKYMDSINLQNMLIIRHHYNCSRNDTSFWKLYKDTELPKQLKLITKGNFLSIKTQEDLMEILKVKNSIDIIFSIYSYILINVQNFVKTKKTLI
jgi:tryptophan halogenase